MLFLDEPTSGQDPVTARDVDELIDELRIASLPPIAVAYLIAFNVIHPTLGLAVGIAAGLLLIDGLGWRAASAMFDRERLMTGTRS